MSEHIIETETCWGVAFVLIGGTANLREEIVRCGDCKYAEPDDSGRSYYKDMLWCSELGGDDSMPVEYDDFCAWGERRDA